MARRRAVILRTVVVLLVIAVAPIGWRTVAARAHSGISKAGPALTGTDAAEDILTTSATVTPAPESLPDAPSLKANSTGVRVLCYGSVTRFGVGSQQRSAPKGSRLLAFKVQPIPGMNAADPPQLSLRIDGVERGPLVLTSDYVVATVPIHSSAVDLVLTDADVQLAVSLLSGRPDPRNPIVTERTNVLGSKAITRDVSVKVQKGAEAAGVTSGTITVSRVWLSYWGQDGSHPVAADHALLHVMAVVKLAGDKAGYGAEAGLLGLTFPGSAALPARNAAARPNTEVDDVIEVPADFTSGTLSYAGTLRTDKGSITVMTPVTVPLSIPAG